MYDIIHDIIEKPWYHIWYHSLPIPCAIWYCQKSMISYMISYMILKISYFQYDIILNIIYNIIADPFLALFSWCFVYDIIYISYDFVHDVIITWNHTWNCLWYMPLISLLREFIAIRYHIFCDISAHVMVPARRATWSSPSSFKFTGTLRTWMPITYTVLQLFKSY